MTDLSLNGRTVSNILGLANTLLGGGANGYTIADVGALVGDLNVAFSVGGVSTFAQQHLFNGACP